MPRGVMTPALQMRKLMFRIFAAPPEVSVCPFIQFLWKYLLLFGEEKPFPQGLQTKASFSQRYYLCCVTSQPKTGGGLETKVIIISCGWFCGWLAQPRRWDTSLHVPARAASLGLFTASLSG